LELQSIAMRKLLDWQRSAGFEFVNYMNRQINIVLMAGED